MTTAHSTRANETEKTDNEINFFTSGFYTVWAFSVQISAIWGIMGKMAALIFDGAAACP
jgi:hypothetical protein